MEIEFDDKEVQELVEEKRHEEILGALKNVAKSFSDKDDAEIAKAINKQTDDLAKAIANLPKPETPKLPEVKIEYNHEKLVSLLNGFTDNIKESNQKVIEALENRLLPDTFELVKGYGGETQSVKVKYKSAKEINSKK